MEPTEWEQQADRAAVELGAEVSALESAYWPDPPGKSFRSFWPQVKDLNERVRTAPAIKLDDKLRLQHHLNELCHRARVDGKRLRDEREARERELMDALTLAGETLEDARSIDEIQEVRSYIAALRERVTAASREVRASALWSRWQALNQAAWAKLNETWTANEAILRATLDEAEHLLDAGNVREAKEAIKRFHTESATHQCSHQSLRNLRAQSTGLWQRANDLGREKHARYVEHTAKRIEQWRSVLHHHQRVRSALEREIAQLERQTSAAGTQIAAALLRGQLEQRRRELTRLETEDRDLEKRIEAAETAAAGRS